MRWRLASVWAAGGGAAVAVAALLPAPPDANRIRVAEREPRSAPPPAAAATAPEFPTGAASVAPDAPIAADGDGGDVASDDGRAAGSDERRRRWRRRNIYPGPIPTPAEWEPPEGPVRIGLQAGHWRVDEAPSELRGLRSGGTSWQGGHEWEVNLDIVRRTASLLEGEGYVVDVLPAVVPPGYRAHLFISVHADGSGDPRATGFRVSGPRRDATGRASGMVDLLQRSYADATGLPLIPTVTRRMRGYYAFNFRRYRHALHPMTVAVILETGFLTSAGDRSVIVEAPDRAARGIVEAVKAFPVTRIQAEDPQPR